MNAESIVLEARKLGVAVGGKPVCNGLDLSLRRGERWGVLGLNGAGKTSLLHTLAGIRPPAAGEILLDGELCTHQSRRSIARRMGVMFQDSDEAFPSTVLEAALVGRHPYLGAWQWEGAREEALARNALAAVGLADFAQRSTATLSGGERRRLALATLLVQDPQLFLLDEPINHLDVHHQIAVLDLLARLAATERKTLFMVLHDVNLAARYCDHVLLLGDGEAQQGPARDLLTVENLARLYHHPMRRIPMDGGDWFYPG